MDNFKNYFIDKTYFETIDIANYYEEIEPQIKQSTVNWRIYSLVQKGILQRIGRGKFIIGNKMKFIPEISSKTKSIYSKIHKEFPFSNLCVWHTSWLNEFMQHQPNQFYYLVEVEKESTESVFYFLKETNNSVFLNPNSDILNKYLSNNKDVLIVKHYISESPIQKISEIKTATIEKILVDIYCDEIIFAAQQGFEMRTIFNNVYERYAVNESKMLRYANRRKKKESFKEYINSINGTKVK